MMYVADSLANINSPNEPIGEKLYKGGIQEGCPLRAISAPLLTIIPQMTQLVKKFTEKDSAVIPFEGRSCLDNKH